MKLGKTLLFFMVVLAFLSFPFVCFAEKTTIIYGTTEKVTDMDTSNAYDFHTWEIFQNANEGLMKYKIGETTLMPGLAESYTASADGKEYIFKLRKGLKFSDGSPLDAKVFQWTIERAMKLKGDPSWLITDFVSKVEAVDELTVKFTLKNPVAYFPALVASPPYFPLNPKVYPADKIIKNPNELTGGKLVGAGQYVVTSFKRDQEIVLEANPNYYGEKAKNDRVVIRYFADATTMRLALEKGELDLAFKTLNPSDIKDLQKSDKLNTIVGEGPYIRYICFVCDKEPFNDKVLRQAVAAAVNRPDLIQKVFLGQNMPLHSMVPKGMWSHEDSFKDLGDGNVAKVKELLAAKGYNEQKPLTFDFWYSPSHYGDTEVKVAEVLKAQFEATGVIKVNVKSAEWATYKDNWSKKVMPVYLLGWYPDYIDPDNYTAAFAGTEGSRGNGIYFSDKVWDAKLAAAASAPQDKRTALYQEIQKMWLTDVPTVPFMQGSLYVFTQKNVKGVKLSPTLIFNYGPIEKGK
jgi:peptide/nickel transport system substrate-binding protein